MCSWIIKSTCAVSRVMKKNKIKWNRSHTSESSKLSLWCLDFLDSSISVCARVRSYVKVMMFFDGNPTHFRHNQKRRWKRWRTTKKKIVEKIFQASTQMIRITFIFKMHLRTSITGFSGTFEREISYGSLQI